MKVTVENHEDKLDETTLIPNGLYNPLFCVSNKSVDFPSCRSVYSSLNRYIVSTQLDMLKMGEEIRISEDFATTP